MTYQPKRKWRRTNISKKDGTVVPLPDDWSLIDTSERRLARLWNTQQPDMLGSWRWRVWLDQKIYEGSARTGTEARESCERPLAEFLQAQMVKLP